MAKLLLDQDLAVVREATPPSPTPAKIKLCCESATGVWPAHGNNSEMLTGSTAIMGAAS
jgi:hypothetical protein